MSEDARRTRFEAQVLPHLDAAWNLARWLTRNEHDAQDVVQDACVRAYQFLDGLRGDKARPWLLAIVRNTAYSWMEANRRGTAAPEDAAETASPDAGPEALCTASEISARIRTQPE